MSAIDAFRDELLAIDGMAPLVTAYVDLSQSKDGTGPAGDLVARRAFVVAEEAYGATLARDRKSLDEDREALRASVDEARAEGAMGLVYVGCAAEGLRRELATPQPFRNDVRLGSRPWLFEMERYRYLLEQRVTLALADLHTIDMVRIGYGEVEASDELDYDQHGIARRAGRNDIQGRGGPRGIGLAAGHSKNKVQESMEAHRAMFARDAAGHLAQFAEEGDLLIVAGAEEPRAQLLQELPKSLAEKAILRPATHLSPDDREMVTTAAHMVVEHQHEQANRAAEEWLSGAFGERGVGGIAAMQLALGEGKLGEMVIHENVAGHWGDAGDARRHEPLRDDMIFEDILRAAINTSVIVRFGTDDRLLDEHEGVVGLLRW
jgi:hypothetical protein